MRRSKDDGYQFIRFVLTWTIVVHHVLTTSDTEGIRSPFLLHLIVFRLSGRFGQLAVSMFFMLSGALLWRIHPEREDLLPFWKHRFLKMLVPLWVCTVPFLLIETVRDPELLRSEYLHSTFLFNLLGMDMVPFVLWEAYPYHLCGEWFTTVILALYLIYPLLRRGFAEKRTRAVLCVCVFSLCAVNLKIGFLSKSDWFSFSRGLFFFLAGMLFEEYRDRLDSRKITAAFAGCFLVIFVFFGRSFLGSGRLPNIISALCVFPVLYRLPGMLKRVFALPFVSVVIDGTCAVSYLIYLTHHYLIELLMPAVLPEEPGTVLFYLFTAGICALIYGYTALMAFPVNAVLKRCLISGRKTAA